MKKIKCLFALSTLLFFVLCFFTGCAGSGIPDNPELDDLAPDAQMLGEFTATQAIEKIKSLENGSYAIKITGEITAEDINNIKEAMYKNMDRLIALDLSETTGLTKLPGWAFSDVDKLDQEGGAPLSAIILPECITEFEENCFRECNELKACIAPGVTILRTYTLAECKKLATMKFADVMDLMEESSIGWNDAITEFTLNAKDIGARMLPGCDKLTKIIIGPDVESFADGPFVELDKVTEILVAEGNNYFKSVDGMLYSADGTRFIKYPCGRKETLNELSLSEQVTRIDGHSFSYSKINKVSLPNISYVPDCAFWWSSIKEVSIPKATEIGSHSFYCCSHLNKISLSNTLKKIKEAAFYNTKDLESIFIPSSVTSIALNAFYGWEADQTINCQAESEPASWNTNWKNECYSQIHWGVNP